MIFIKLIKVYADLDNKNKYYKKRQKKEKTKSKHLIHYYYFLHNIFFIIFLLEKTPKIKSIYGKQDYQPGAKIKT